MSSSFGSVVTESSSGVSPGSVSVANRMPLAGFSVHHGHTVEIDIIDEDHGTAIWSMQDYLRVPGDKNFIGYGHYHEEYRRVGERWLISKCTLTRLHVDPLEGENALGT